jgi:hypothetical protein
MAGYLPGRLPLAEFPQDHSRRSTRADSHTLFNIAAICLRSFLVSWTCTR